MSTTFTAPRTRVARVLRALAVGCAAALVVVAGVWVAGALIADDFRVSMALTAAWFAVAGGAAFVTLRARRSVGVPILAGYFVAAVAVGGFLAAPALRDRVVHESVATGMPASMLAAARAEAPANVLERAGRFRSGEHATRGTARVIRLPDGRRVLTLTGFSTSPGPDLRVRIVAGGGSDGGADGVLDVGALKGNKGDQQYGLPAGFRPGSDDVLIWCRAFSALFGSARLEPA